MIARALAQAPRLLLLDEITAFLDLPGRVEVMVILRVAARARGLIVLLSSHDLDLSLQIADRIRLLAGDGVLHYDGVFWLEQVRTCQPVEVFTPARIGDSPERPLAR